MGLVFFYHKDSFVYIYITLAPLYHCRTILCVDILCAHYLNIKSKNMSDVDRTTQRAESNILSFIRHRFLFFLVFSVFSVNIENAVVTVLSPSTYSLWDRFTGAPLTTDHRPTRQLADFSTNYAPRITQVWLRP